MKSIMFAAALTLGLGAYTLPAFAQADDYGQHVYTQNEQSRFAPAGQSIDRRDFQANVEFDDRDAVSSNTSSLQKLYDRQERDRSQW